LWPIAEGRYQPYQNQTYHLERDQERCADFFLRAYGASNHFSHCCS
jgi:hypothetical protein